MAVLLQSILPISPTLSSEAGGVRTLQSGDASIPGNGSSAEVTGREAKTSSSASAPDVVKVQIEPPGEIVVYRFVNQQGTLVLQVPPQQLLDLAQQISKELAPKATLAADTRGGDNHGD